MTREMEQKKKKERFLQSKAKSSTRNVKEKDSARAVEVENR